MVEIELLNSQYVLIPNLQGSFHQKIAVFRLFATEGPQGFIH